MSSSLRPLWESLDLKLSEVLQVDLALGVVGGVASCILAFHRPHLLLGVAPVAAGVVGVIITAVVAGVTVQAAFFDQPFLRKLRAINKGPVYYMAPFLFTATIGVLALLLLLVLAVVPETAPVAALATLGAISGLLTVWTIASLLSCLSVLVQFVELKVDALDVPDDIGATPNRITTLTPGGQPRGTPEASGAQPRTTRP